jgi:MFS family permease
MGNPGDRDAWIRLLVIASAVLLGMSVWFAASAVSPALADRWELSSSQVGGLTTLVQLGFVAGTLTAALLGLADSIPARFYFACSAALAASANAALLVAPGYESALATRFLTGVFLAGVYPPAMKMTATWFRTNRGLAIGVVIGALTAGKAMPYLVGGLETVGIRVVIVATSAAAGLAALLVVSGYRDGPHAFPARPFSFRQAAEVIGTRRWRLATGGYLGHMWELYAYWTWIAAFLAAAAAEPGATDGFPGRLVRAAPFLAIAIGAVGCVWGGRVADRIGYEALTIRCLAVSGTCAVLVGALFGGPFLPVFLVVLVWGFFVIADSAQFSAAVTEVVPPDVVGTALTLQVALGFLLTMATIQLVPLLAATFGWRWAFPVLALGPAGGIASMRALASARALA